MKHIIKQVSALALLASGFLITVATSPVEPDPGPWEWGPDEIIVPIISGSLFLAWPLETGWSQLSEEEFTEATERRNRNLADRYEVLVSQLNADLRLDCDEINKAPLDYLNTEMFADPVVYSLAQGDVIEVNVASNSRSRCTFLHIIGSGISPTIVGLNFESWKRHSVSANGIEESELTPDTLVVDGQSLRLTPDSEFVSSLNAISQVDESEWTSCEPHDQHRLTWDLPYNEVTDTQLSEVQRGVDGCHQLIFTDEQSMLICAPWEALSALDQAWWVEASEERVNHTETLTVNLYESQSRLRDKRPSVILEGLKDALSSLSFRYALKAQAECEPVKRDCYTAQPMQLDLDAEQAAAVERGQLPAQLPDLESGKQHWLLTAERRVIIESSCESSESVLSPEPHYYLENFIVTDLRGEE